MEHRREPNGISVIVVGAGVGGLATALECWRVGCDVSIFERASSNITTGNCLASMLYELQLTFANQVIRL